MIDGHLRVSTAQRENALQIVRDAAADGRLEFADLESRVARVMAAVTRDDVAGVLADLVPSAELHQVVADAPPLGEGPGYRWEEPVLIKVGSDGTRIGGDWLVPPFLEVHTTWAGAKLDFTRARAAGPLIDLVLVGSYGAVTIVVPEGWGVDLTSVQADSSAQVSSTVRTRPTPGHPRIVVRGRTGGGVKARTPSRFDQWQDRRRPAQPPTSEQTLAITAS